MNKKQPILGCFFYLLPKPVKQLKLHNYENTIFSNSDLNSDLISMNLSFTLNDSIKLFDLNGNMVNFTLTKNTYGYVILTFDKKLKHNLIINIISKGKHNQIKL